MLLAIVVKSKWILMNLVKCLTVVIVLAMHTGLKDLLYYLVLLILIIKEDKLV